MTGAAVLPVFAVVRVDRQVDIFVEPAVPDASVGEAHGGTPWASAAVCVGGEWWRRYVRAYPEQWLRVQPACVEDASAPPPGEVPRRKVRGGRG